MFGLPSLGKILVVVAILAAVWFGFRLVARLDRERRQALKEAADGKPTRRAEPGRAVRDLTECGKCHAFVVPAPVCSACGGALRG